MELGAKIRQARMDAGLTQEQLCQGKITRNMLSQIENGSADPSLSTLRFLAARLEKPLSFFLEEEASVTFNQNLMEICRKLYDTGAYGQVLSALRGYREQDPVFDGEKAILHTLSVLALAQAAVQEEKWGYIRELLELLPENPAPYIAEEVRRRCCIIRSHLPGQNLQPLAKGLPDISEELYLLAEAALENADGERAEKLLHAIGQQPGSKYFYLLGKACQQQQHFEQALQYYEKAEQNYPKQTAEYMEICCRELGDFRRAYYYACKRRDLL